MPYHTPPIIARRPLDGLLQLTLGAPELARAARPGHYALAQCAAAESADPLLRRPIFLAGADPAAGTVDLLVDPRESGLAALAARPVGAPVDLFAPLGAPFSLDPRARTLLLAGAGPALPALVFLARASAARLSLVLLAAGDAGFLPPPALLPTAVELQTSDAGPAGLAELLAAAAGPTHPIAWADQIALALTSELVEPAAAAIRRVRLRWERGFALAALAGPTPCGSGACQACLVETRAGWRTRCKDGPVFDLRDLRT